MFTNTNDQSQANPTSLIVKGSDGGRFNGIYYQLMISGSDTTTKGFYHSQWNLNRMVTLQITGFDWTLTEWLNIDGAPNKLNKVWRFHGAFPSGSQPITFLPSDEEIGSMDLEVKTHTVPTPSPDRTPSIMGLQPPAHSGLSYTLNTPSIGGISLEQSMREITESLQVQRDQGSRINEIGQGVDNLSDHQNAMDQTLRETQHQQFVIGICIISGLLFIVCLLVVTLICLGLRHSRLMKQHNEARLARKMKEIKIVHPQLKDGETAAGEKKRRSAAKKGSNRAFGSSRSLTGPNGLDGNLWGSDTNSEINFNAMPCSKVYQLKST